MGLVDPWLLRKEGEAVIGCYAAITLHFIASKLPLFLQPSSLPPGPPFSNPPSVGDAHLDGDIKSRLICSSLSPEMIFLIMP
jgi:hypothetical protein